ncbi:MAG: hypothetical protein QOI10_973 [Solirubrobacterales bacterium]|jgi:hypothetical protein|nr:hypothetical protein [Solirubrobacterales bacterium]
MSGRISGHLRRNAYGLVAVFIALGGSAFAAEQAAKNSVTSRSIKNGQVKVKDLAGNSVDSTKVADGSLTPADLQGGSLTGAAIADDSLTGADIEESTLQGLGGGGGGGPATPTGPAGGDLAGTYPDPSIAPNAVTAAKVLDDTLDTADINDATLAFSPGSTHDVLGTLGNAQLNANSVGSTEVFPNSLSGTDINEATVQIAGEVTGNLDNVQIAADAVGNAAMADNAIGKPEMADNAIGNAEMDDNAIGSAEVSTGSLHQGDLAMGTGTGVVDPSGSVGNGACSGAVDTAGLASGSAPVGSNTFAMSDRQNGATNTGWVVVGVQTATANTGRVKVCNHTGVTGDPPSMVFEFFTLAP